ncbi:glycosyltransferase family 2 protein [Klugiella xanthotipulae]|uniref:glycosyltransferase family 2 protein n=1 Tax=Klugiella xanthotipulae TaxID=244735 RepID=UPI00114F30E5|nr:glycosyltransferase family 2 protein [Klugiella xanthotipulae]
MAVENASGIYLLLLVYIIFQLVLAALERPIVATPSQQIDLDQLSVVALVPAYNEDPAMLVRCLRGFLEQTRRPDAVVVIDDGSTSSDYREVRDWFARACAEVGVRGSWERQPNRGKRAAQIAGVEVEPGADIYITVDSDSILDRHAVEQALYPFADPEVQSVAGVILTTNVSTNLLTRMMDVYCLGIQLFERSAFSRLGSVMVNSGGCAFYRGDVIRENISTYLGETLFRRPVHFSDDSMLTLFALLRGRAVQQPTAFAFTLMPDRFSHHRRQQVRWMRGSFIRSGWRMRYLPLDRWAYWLHAMKWGMYAAMTAAFLRSSLAECSCTPSLRWWELRPPSRSTVLLPPAT